MVPAAEDWVMKYNDRWLPGRGQLGFKPVRLFRITDLVGVEDYQAASGP